VCHCRSCCRPASRSRTARPCICRAMVDLSQTGSHRETRRSQSLPQARHLRPFHPQGRRLRRSRERRCRPIGHRDSPVRPGPCCRRNPGRTRRNRCPTSRSQGRNPDYPATPRPPACQAPSRQAPSSPAPVRQSPRRRVACIQVVPTNQEPDSWASWNQVLAPWARDRRLGHGGHRPASISRYSISRYSIRRAGPGDWNLSLPPGWILRRDRQHRRHRRHRQGRLR
jgi:hypothetical protein